VPLGSRPDCGRLPIGGNSTATAFGRTLSTASGNAAVHAEAATAADTDWKQIAALYGELARIQPSATVTLNRAVAIAMGEGIEQGLDLLESLGASGALDSYHLFHAARADLLRRLSRNSEAVTAYQKALSLTANAVEPAFSAPANRRTEP